MARIPSYVLALLVTWMAGPSLQAADNPPNIILVFIDDMGWGDFSCFGNQEARTPNIDRLASEGIAFEQFYVNSPICSPSRVAISTGTYPQRWGIHSYLNNRQDNARRGMANWLDLRAPVLARSLKQVGYATGHFGKWHMGGQRDVGEAPLITEYGFDESLTNFEGLGPRVLPLKYAPGGKPPGRHGLRSETLGKGPVIWHDRAYITGDFTEAALTFAQVQAAAGKPFYINLWPDDVHTPMHPPLKLWGDGSKRHLYLQVLETMDAQFGPLFEFIEKNEKLRNNTLIAICSDNGPEVDFGSAGPLRGHKATLYEGGVRSSLVVWAPGLMKQSARGTRNTSSIFSAIDLVPSLRHLAGAKLPKGSLQDGEDLLETILGQGQSGRQAPLFFRRPPDREQFRHYDNLPDLAVRSGQWKLYCDYDGGHPELYDLVADPSETRNVASAHPETVQKLSGQLLAWHHEMPADKGPEIGKFKPSGQGKP